MGPEDRHEATDGAPLETYLATVEPAAAPIAAALDRAVRAAYPDFSIAVKHRMLMYTLHDEWRTWVCAVDVSRHRACLRFLYGVMLDDPLGVLRAGSSVLKTWDFALDAAIDEAAIGDYVREAVARRDAYVADSAAVQAKSRAAARPARPPTGPASR